MRDDDLEASLRNLLVVHRVTVVAPAMFIDRLFILFRAYSEGIPVEEAARRAVVRLHADDTPEAIAERRAAVERERTDLRIARTGRKPDATTEPKQRRRQPGPITEREWVRL